MKKKAFSLILAAAMFCSMFLGFPARVRAAEVVKINEENFPDPIFRTLVRRWYDEDENGVLDSKELDVYSLNLDGHHIEDLTGIEYFRTLSFLHCENNQLTKLDLSGNTSLYVLYCDGNPLTSLDLSGNPVLSSLSCNSSDLTELDLSHNPALTWLRCEGYGLASLDLTYNTELESLYCGNNEFTSLDLSHQTKLLVLSCNSNQLTTLDLSHNPLLERLECSDGTLTELDVSCLPNLMYLNCGFNSLRTLDLSGNPLLDALSCDGNSLKELDTSKNRSLKSLNCGLNSLEKLVIGNNRKMTSLFCDHNRLTSLDLTLFPALDFLDCTGNCLTTLDLRQNTALHKVYCSDNALTSLNTSVCKLLRELDCSDNKLTSLDLSNNPSLEELSCQGNQLSGLDISQNECLAAAYHGGEEHPGSYRYEYGSVYSGCYHRYALTVDAGLPVFTEITAKPVITKQPVDQTVAVGKKAAFSVEAEGGTKFQWYYRTSPGASWKTIAAASGKTPTYTLTTAARHNGYQYRCKVTNRMGSTYTEIRTLTVVTEKPVITAQPKNKTVNEGSKAAFSVKVEGEGLTYQWYYRVSSSDSWKKCIAASGKTANYTLSAQARHNGYQYRCKVTNPMGYVYTKIVTLTVK